MKVKPMSRPLKLLPLFALMLIVGGAVAAHAITWTSPTYPFYGAAGTGPIYFSSSFECTNGSWTGGLIRFSDFNYAGSGNFGTWGIGAEAGLSTTILEMAPDTYMLMQTSSAGTENATLWFPDLYVVNCTNTDAWTWNNATKILTLTSPAGGAQVRVSFVEGDASLIFIIPWWFINQGGVIFGVADFFANLSSVMTAFVAWFLDSVGNVISLIYWVMTALMFMAGTVIDWLGRIVGMLVAMFTIIGSVFDGSFIPGSLNIWAVFNVSQWIDFVPLLLFILWFDGLPRRSRQTGQGWFTLITGDVQKMMYVVDLVWGWSWTVFNFVFGVVMQFVSLLWGLIP